MGARVVVQQVVDVAGRDERQTGRLGEPGQLRVDPLLRLEPRILDLDVRRVLAEDLDEPVEVGGGVLRPASSSAFETRPERHPERTTSPGACRSSSSQSTRGL